MTAINVIIVPAIDQVARRLHRYIKFQKFLSCHGPRGGRYCQRTKIAHRPTRRNPPLTVYSGDKWESSLNHVFNTSFLNLCPTLIVRKRISHNFVKKDVSLVLVHWRHCFPDNPEPWTPYIYINEITRVINRYLLNKIILFRYLLTIWESPILST